MFGHAPTGDPVQRVTLRGGGLTAKVITWGGSLQDLRRDGVPHRLVLGSEDFSNYLGPLTYCGAIVGRVANRIAGGRITLDGRTYDLDRNEADRTTLHGGSTGTAEVNWRLVAHGAASCRLAVTLADGQAGFLRDAKGLAPGDRVLVQVSTYAERGKSAPVTRAVSRRRRRRDIQMIGIPSAVTTSAGQNLFGKNLKQRSIRHRTDSIHAFRVIKAQSAALPASHRDNGHFSVRQQLFTDCLAFPAIIVIFITFRLQHD